jgi:hypothetical protein
LSREVAIPDPPAKDVFDPVFLSELEGLVAQTGMAVSAAGPGAGVRGYHETLAAFLAPFEPGAPPLNESAFVGLLPPLLAERTNGLIASCRKSPRREGAQAVESFIVFFQTLVPTLGPEAAWEVKGTFFRLVPALVQMAWDEVSPGGVSRRDSGEALRLLETILLEVSSVKLAPLESGLLFKSLDQLATLIANGEYSLARDVVAAPLLALLRKNRVARSLFRLMEVEVAVQSYVKERLGHASPQIQVPKDVPALAEFGPLRVFDEDGPGGERTRYLQVQLPDLQNLSDIVVRLSSESDGFDVDLRLDGLGSAEFDVPPGLYRIGLLYAPDGSRGEGG